MTVKNGGAMSTEIQNMLSAAGSSAQYDENAKRLLGNKYILAYILKASVEEFHETPIETIVDCIEGEPLLDVVPVEPGLTNMVHQVHGQRVIGFNSEQKETNEGTARFDIIFYVRMSDGISKAIINVEAQRKDPEEYDLLNRAIFYVGRILSSQKERDFVRKNYNDIRRVFSIWVCMNMSQNSLNHIHLVNNSLLGDQIWKGRLDLVNIVLIGLAKELPTSEQNEIYGLHRLLGVLLSPMLTAGEKLDILDEEYEIPVEDQIREEVSIMCNLSQDILERGLEQGLEQGFRKGQVEGETRGKAIGKAIGETNIILRMYQNGFTVEQIAHITDKKESEIQELLENKI